MLRNRNVGPLATALLAALAIGDLAVTVAGATGLRVNATASMPEGIYRVRPYRGEPLAHGTIVAICPGSAVVALATSRRYLAPGSCPGRVEPLLKHVVATAGDVVELTERDVRVDGAPLASSARLAHDCVGRPLPRIAVGRYRIGAESAWLYAPEPRSWDSRYFGSQPLRNVVGVARPLLTVPPHGACASAKGG